MDSTSVPPPAVLTLNKANKANQAKCRACLSVNRKTVKLDAKMPDLQKPSTYGQGLRRCTNLELSVSVTASGYKFPMQICIRCCRALEVAMHFVEMALDSHSKLYAESQRIKPSASTAAETIVGELKRKASDELLHWNQFSQEFEQFVESYDGVPGPIEENVLYMRGAKMPRLDSDVMSSSKPPKEDDIILFDVKYDTNNQDAEDENDGSDAKNNETFFENSIINGHGEVDVESGAASTKSSENNNNNNNNNYKFNNKNGDMSGLPDVECDLIERAIYMTLNDVPNSDQKEEIKFSDTMTNESSSATPTHTKGSDNLDEAIKPASPPTQLPTSSAVWTPLHIPLLSCNICNYTHKEAKQLRNHYMTAHNFDMHEDDIIGLTKNQSFKCRPCNSYETKNRADMQKHLIDHHKIDGDFEMFCYVQQNCPACARVFKDQRSARTHYTRMHTQPHSEISEQQQIYKCTACDKVFNQKYGLNAHQRFCQEKEPVQCNFCTEQFTSMRRYEAHLQQQHSVDTLHECEICHKNFKNAETLAIHRKRHSERHYQCDKCSLNYINATELRTHYERAHVQHETLVSCQSCDSKFPNFALLREHEQRNHQKQKVWRCDNCSFETRTRFLLRQHQFEHMDYPYKCIKCAEEFVDRGKFRYHSKKLHGIDLTDDQLAEMFRERTGYTNRYDIFNKTNNSLEIPGFSDDCFNELRDLGVDYDEITNDLFANSAALDNLLDLIP
ncbi:uncharacterized protein Dwil_GK15912 [Drosophila willistoni]|uniref:C2H2-type domain-containing protein n=1 Tax=Drosophila willistoni TaxID=7260 RepID=B4MRX9_DROWI|nr:zinc finger protein 782 [Drosophila willistoni]EDW74868.1 uncharacterized protein Dwil_GK15912 [Drosophila willistoni]